MRATLALNMLNKVYESLTNFVEIMITSFLCFIVVRMAQNRQHSRIESRPRGILRFANSSEFDIYAASIV